MKWFILMILSLVTVPSHFAGTVFYKDIKVRQAEKLIREDEGKGTLVILDVRSPGEFANGWIMGAINIDFWGKNFTDSVSKLDRTMTYLVYCASGVRSSGAMRKMKELGFERIYNMRGGMFAWRAARKEVVKRDAL